MTLELIHHHQQASPFEPFDICLADQRIIPARNPELLMVADDGRSLTVFLPPGITEIIDPALIVSLRFGKSQP